MEKEKDELSNSRSSDAQIDLFTLIGGSWPPAPCVPAHPGYRSAPVSRRHTMQRPSQNERIKSVNLIEHIVPDRRRNKPHGASSSFEEQQKNVSNENPEELYDSPVLGSPRVAPPPLKTSPDEIGVGSLVEVATDVDQHHYGVDSPHYSEVQRVLREQIVNPLRRHGYVRADRVMKLRTLLERLSDVPGLTSEEKDPEEFLNGLVAQLLRAEPFLKLSSGQESFCYQLFVEKDEHVSLPTVQQLLEQSFATSGVKLSEVPSTLIIQMPRFGKQYKLYQQVLPSPLLDVTDLIEGLPRQCAVCGSLARWECAACAAPDGGVLEAGAFCAPCLRVVHNSRPQHKCGRGVRQRDGVQRAAAGVHPRQAPRDVALVALRGLRERNGYNIPEIVSIDDLGAWLAEESERASHATQRDATHAAPSTRPRPLHARRLLSDAYMCFYRSPDVAMYR
ncbi:40S ribosomal protein S3a [Operophtera brumata]|uniref:40S ribosomal protein S3a n=1 Tax=Operophtera brumata TaxID=104452 RepID=A0A0L7L4Q4_OPEBR|nr:40S ribosomal protein S3a [Operophtera brumata]